MGEELSRELGCPVVVSFFDLTREVVAVAHPELGDEIRINLPVSLMALVLENSYAAVRCDLLKQLRLQLDRRRRNH
jgi:hypothetical protein